MRSTNIKLITVVAIFRDIVKGAGWKKVTFAYHFCNM